MKKTFVILFIGLAAFLNAYDMNVDHIKLSPKTIEAAIHVYNIEIKQFEDCCSIDESLTKKLLSLYIARADLYFAKKDYRAALSDYKKVISYVEDTNVNLVDPADFLGGICGCLFCYQCLEEDETAKQEFNKLVYHVALMGEEIETISWIKNSQVYPMYKRNHKNMKERILSVGLPEMTPEEFCEFQCAGYAVAASSACFKVPNLAIAALCGGCLWGLEQLCLRCCKGDGFWENCVKPLRRLFHDPSHPTNPAPHPYE